MKNSAGMKRWLSLLILSFLMTFFACTNNSSDPDDPARNPNLPVFETSADALQQTFDEVTGNADGKLKEIAELNIANLTFEDTIKALEDLYDAVNLAYYRSDLLKDVHPDETIRNKGFELSEKYQNWLITAQANGDVYRIIKAYADTQPNLDAEEKKLLNETVLSFKRAGFNDQGVVDPAIITKKNEMTTLQTAITKKVGTANKAETLFSREELEGLSDEQLAGLTQNEAGAYIVLSGDRGTLRDLIMSYAIHEATRKKAKAISNSRAADNIADVTGLIKHRVELAKLLGYASWADYKTEPNMAKDGLTAFTFIDGVSTKLRTKLDTEIAALAAFMETGINDDNGVIDSWDVYYFKRLFESQQLQVDYEAIRQYFKYDEVLYGMFDIFEEVFGLQINPVTEPYVWHKDVSMVEIADDTTGEVLGYLYLDMFPRLDQGKMGHFASYGLINGMQTDSGDYRKPVNVLVCNFPINADGTPQNLLFNDISTLFHEFGHALHCILSTAKFSSQTAFHVPQDFVEVPSQVLENWLFDEAVFKMLATDHPDVTDQWVKDTIAKIKNASQSTVALFYARQFAFGKMDLAIHQYTDVTQVPGENDPNNLIKVTNDIMASTYLPFPESSHLITAFNHLMVWGYDAGYYGYAWADSIVAELTQPFENSSYGFFDRELGMKLREEIFESGATRDVNTSCEYFLGKELDPERNAFLNRLGVQ